MTVESVSEEEVLQTILLSHAPRQDELIPILQEVQAEFGYLSEQSMLGIARYVRVPESKVYAVASFYAQFRFTPMGRQRIQVCRGTACYVNNAMQIVEAIKARLGIEVDETTEDLEYTLETVACIGACSLSPCVMINERVEAKLTPRTADALFGKRSKPRS